MSTMRLEKKVHDKDVKKEIKIRRAGKIDVQLGKKGITQGFINEVKNRLENNGVVKIRILRSFLKSSGISRREIARRVAELVGAKLLEVRGNTFILVKKYINKGKYRSLNNLGEENKSRE